MHIAFRTDASLQIGTGHVMRCLTLADALRERGAQSTFICRPHAGHLQNLIHQRGHSATALAPADDAFTAPTDPSHAQWLGTDWARDAEQTRQALGGQVVDCLVVDHYALDRRWEQALRPHTRSILVIDDLADRPHQCDLLLDQNLGRRPEHYNELVPPHCQVLTGSHYAVLRPEFSALRAYSMERRKTQPALRQLLITMGGVDQPNATGKVLQVLKTCALPRESRITVVMGLTAPWLESVKELAAQMPWPTAVVVNVNDMAQRMADSDLAIGAAGSTSWERCCLGLPSILVILADNQNSSCAELGAVGAAEIIGKLEHVEKRLPDQLSSFLAIPHSLKICSDAASSICNGTGATFVVDEILTCATSVH
ncbi:MULTISPECIES: UDP-2,4-diacetamido-2,4,6-trideoxy-beta-L-altropyranose hydrolase [Comamonadaceae]|uniref:UDP-2,4-diacetamido-2,4, 6-trideoxy-beta-L-altropyranose hydrolase n=1 Tax=Comamonadaceae TaxID=80864 RepID=UPI00271AA8F4|nr:MULTISPECIES: UDP-2,4-diacetamido-2,4,6-trideoxy-beta-L-altropyranose hydrolase [Comamonadaceae]MDO9145886.1 UDP-2,4-diacetamido-2,4,6-trideoxy-beta-L-altropyranose hydrolase [Rhodoferax sp.]MDP3887627.1 UDP-2,4-diacetamido-2,4,6-trideoxy-beta-L-altropyranose hydrolase [Hydrogenophaga sp.]